MNRKLFNLLAAFVLVLAMGSFAIADTCSTGAFTTDSSGQQVCDLNSNGAGAVINGGLFGSVLGAPTGTGVYSPFLRLQQSPNEGAWNENYTSQPDVPLNNDAKSDPHTHSVLLSDLAVLTGTDGNTYYEFKLDLAEPTSGSNAEISLNNVSIFDSAISNPSDSGCVGNDPTGSSAQIAPTCLGHLDWNMDGGTDSSVTLHSELHPGNGIDNMTLFVPTSAFANATGAYMIFWTQFGDPPGNFSSDASFEEWGYTPGPNAPPPVPEPGTLALFGTGLLSIAGFIRRKMGA